MRVIGLISGTSMDGIDVAAASPMELIPYEPLLGMVSALVRGTTDMLAAGFLVALVAIFLLFIGVSLVAKPLLTRTT